jgi:predicted 2-oxoglutarate/Fe(II)-dependent dioxygenase YbiX
MSIRLQVLLPDDEWREIRQVARARRMTVAEWVRQALREVRQRQPATDGRKKIEVVRSAARHAFPTADIDQMLIEIERGYSGG